MTTERLDIAVRQKGAKKVTRDIAGIGGAAVKANKGIALLTAGIAGIAAVGVARQVIGLANSYQQLSNKVRVAVGEQGDLNGTIDELFAIADRTRGPVDALVTLYQRGSLAANELGASQKDLLEFTETVGTALALQGGAASEASGALLQLSQSLGSGIVRAEEFNSILEGAFPIARAAAKGIDEAGGSVAKLRQLVIEGKVSSDVFFQAILSQGDDLKRQFQNIAPTVDQALTRIKNSFIQAAGSGNLDPLVDSLNDFADLISDPGFQQSFGLFVSGIVDLAATTVSLASEFGDLGQQIGFAAASLSGNITLVDELEQELKGVRKAIRAEDAGGLTGFLIKPIAFTGDSVEELRAEEARILAEIERINASFDFVTRESTPDAPRETASITGGATGIDPKVQAAQQNFLAGLARTNEELEIQARLGEAAGAALQRYATEQEIIALQLSPAQAESARAVTEAIIAQNAEIERQSQLSQQNDFILNLEQQEERLRIQAEAGEDAAAALLLYDTQLAAVATGAGPEFVDLALDIANGINAQTEALQEQQRIRDNQNVLDDLQAEAELIGLSNRERAIEIQLRRLSAEATQDQIDKVRDLAGQLFDEGEALRRAGITFDEFLKENARAIQQTLSGALSNALTDGFDDLPSEFAKVLQQLASQYLASGIFQALSGIGQGGNNAFLQGVGDFFAGGFATGGDFRVPGSGGVDSQLVSFKATPGEEVSIRRPGDKDREGGMTPQVNVAGPTIINALDASEITGAFQDGEGDNVLLNRISVRKSAFRRALGINN